MGTHYDAIVIGAGLGGLSAAAFLARGGLSVRVLERHVQPGGYATTFMRGGHEFEVSLHELSGIGPPEDRGGLWEVLDALDITSKVDFVQIPEFYRAIGPDLDLRVPVGREAALDAFCRAFPRERKGLTRLMDTSFAIQAAGTAIGVGKDVNVAVALARFPHAVHAATVPLAKVLDRELRDPLARLAWAQIWGYFGLPPSRLSYVYFAGAIASYIRFGPSYPRGKSQALSNAFVEVIEEAGGRVSLGNGVRRVLTDAGRVTGVIDDHDELLSAGLVVSNANPISTCVDLIGAKNVPQHFLRRLASARPSLSAVTVYLMLDDDHEACGLLDHELFLNSSIDIEEQYLACLDLGQPRGLSVTTYNVADQEFSPPGTTAVSLTALTEGAAWVRLDPADYPATKARLADQMVAQVNSVFPGFRDRIRTAAVATPITNMRYTGNVNGSIYGFDMTPAENPAWRLAYEGPLDGLWFTGAWTRPGGGYEPCIESGHACAQQILRRVKGRQPRLPRGPRRRFSLPRPRDIGRHLAAYVPIARDAKDMLRAVAQRAFRAGLDEAPRFLPGDVRAAVQRVHPRRVDARVTEIRPETPSTKTFRLTPLSGSFPPFEAGQYVNVYLEVRGTQTSRPYSISSPPGRLGSVEITVRRVTPGFVGHYLLDDLAVGQVLTVSGPEGDFAHDALTDTDELVFCAGGSGIAPFKSMIESFAERRAALDVTLIYGSRVPEDVIFRRRLEDLAQQNADWFRWALVISEPPRGWKGERGFLDRDCLLRHVPEDTLARKTFYLCGPSEMCQLVRRTLRELDVRDSRVRVEAYGPPQDPTTEPDWPAEVPADAVFEVTIRETGHRFRAPASETLLNTLERHGIVLPTVCRSGSCGTCRLRLGSGRVYSPGYLARRRSDLEAGFIHPCMTFPTSDLELRLP